MRVLILDDSKERHEAFQRIFQAEELTSVYRYSEFLLALSLPEPWDLIHLDHDLGDEIDADYFIDGWGAKQEYNGVHAADRVCELPVEKQPIGVVVHSINSTGAVRMVKTLRAAGISAKWEPFGEVSENV